MANQFDHIPEDLLKERLAEAEKNDTAVKEEMKPSEPKDSARSATGGDKRQRGPFKKKRANTVLTRDEVKEIKAGRKKLRKDMRKQKIRSRREFETVASSLGLYFDKRNGLWLWFLRHWLPALLGLLAVLLLTLIVFAAVTQLRGHFTINMSEKMFREGFTLSETSDFANPSTQLFAMPAENVPCISINQIPKDVNEIDGAQNDIYFAYTYYIRNEGENVVDYRWALSLNSESKNLSSATWMALFVNDKLRIYADPSASGGAEALPALNDNSRGYSSLPLRELATDSDQFQTIATRGNITYYRVIPDTFLSDTGISEGFVEGMKPQEVHKYTVVLWLEGDDPECTDELIGGNLGVEMNYRLASESNDAEDEFAGGKLFEQLWEGLKFWER